MRDFCSVLRISLSLRPCMGILNKTESIGLSGLIQILSGYNKRTIIGHGSYTTLQNSFNIIKPNCYLFVCCSIIFCESISNRDRQVLIRFVCCEELYPSWVVPVICETIWLGYKNKEKMVPFFMVIRMGWWDGRSGETWREDNIGHKKKMLYVIWLMIPAF